MGRDRDPFDRAVTAVRRRLVETGPLQGAPLPVNVLAVELGVSPTPVREALAWLAGEGLIIRTNAGYAAPVHDRSSLSQLYALAGVLMDAGLTQARVSPRVAQMGKTSRPEGEADGAGPSPGEPAGVLDALLAKVEAQLGPFRAAELAVLGAGDAPQAGQARRYYRRRVRRAGDILAKALRLT